MDDFSTNLAKLQSAILEACGREDEWPAKLAAGIYAALDFAAADRAAARILIVDVWDRNEGDHYRQMIGCFSKLLGELAPRDERLPTSSDEALVGSIATVVADHVRSGRLNRLGAIAPELVHLTLLPYLGFDEAKRWTQATARI